MKHSTKGMIVAVGVAMGAAIVALALRDDGDGGPAAAPPSAAVRGLAGEGAAGVPPSSGRRTGVEGAVPGAGASRSRGPAAVAAEETVARAVEELRGLYGYAGVLDTDAARALIARRKAAMDALAGRLAGLGAAGVGPLLDAYAAAATGREKLLLIDALAKNPSGEAAQGLARLLGQEETFSYRQALIGALGESTAPGAEELLAGALAGAGDARERIAAVNALEAGPVGAEALIARVDGDPDVNVRIAAVARLAEIGGEAARPVLDRLAASGEVPSRVRAAAIQALARSFPGDAIAALGPLAGDGEVSVRSAVVIALERLRTTAAMEILKDIAHNDAESEVRARAEQALARMTL